jgi:hypothetical protein
VEPIRYVAHLDHLGHAVSISHVHRMRNQSYPEGQGRASAAVAALGVAVATVPSLLSAISG